MQDHSKSAKRKIRVGILFGGKSAEHEVSLRSAQNVLEALDKERFEPVLIGIDKTGKWHFDPQQKAIGSDVVEPGSDMAVTLQPGNTSRQLVGAYDLKPQTAVDVVFPVLHGPMGEDGTVQGFLELADIPYVGPGILGSAVGMDKDVMKRLLRDAGIPVADFAVLTSAELSVDDAADLIKQLGLPLFVKPANMGSSVGVSRVDKTGDLRQAIEEALQFDVKVLVERAIAGDEIECAVLGNDRPEASIIGRIIPSSGNFYSYEAKYLDEDGAVLEIPAVISKDVSERARETAIETFKVLGCEGMSRVDMFAQKDGTILVNEINTIPGFTAISMYPKLWEASGLPYTDLISHLIDLAIERFEQRHKLRTTYNSHLY
jgi:D-alanine-D-alanine ligase